MGKDKEQKKYCVMVGCDKEAADVCNNCKIPVCEVHGKRNGRFYLCINCIDYLKRLKLR